MPDGRLSRAFTAIDAANRDDPNRIVVRGVQRPKELAHAELVTEWVSRLRPDSGELLLVAARGHHLRRWQLPRSSYPEGRAGYLRWRRDLSERQATDLGAIVAGCGYTAEETARVQQLVRKRGLGSDPDVQALEDAICLTFLETQLAELAARTDDSKMTDILAKTMKKMSPQALALAKGLDLDERGRHLLAAAADAAGDGAAGDGAAADGAARLKG
jgi:hypothetical protein